MPQNQTKTPQTLWEKLLDIQRSIKEFVNSADSDKQKPGENKSAYQYTPGYDIIKAVREKMDSHGLMLVSDVTDMTQRDIEYPVYKFIGQDLRSFSKKEVLCTVQLAYTWVDAETGEKAGPFNTVGMGANGTDKSLASAIALAERYFLLKFFHIPTRDADDEPDAHDSSNLPGLPREAQPMNATDRQIAQGAAGGHPQGRQAVPTMHAPIPSPTPPAPPVQQGYAPAAQPQFQAPQQPQMPVGQQVNVFTNVPTYTAPPGSARRYEPNDPMIQSAEAALSQFDKGTTSFNQMLHARLAELSTAGYNIQDSSFIANIIEGASSKREQRSPNYVI